MTFRAVPKGSLGRFAAARGSLLNQFYPAEIIESARVTKIRAANFTYANLIAGLLNDAEAGMRSEAVTSDALLPRYLAYADPKGRGWRVVARFNGGYSERCIARAGDEDLAERIALLLNRADPGVTIVPRRRRFDWL